MTELKYRLSEAKRISKCELLLFLTCMIENIDLVKDTRMRLENTHTTAHILRRSQSSIYNQGFTDVFKKTLFVTPKQMNHHHR